MTATVNVAGYQRGTIFINGQNYGWSESIDMNAADVPTAAGLLLIYANLRAWTMPSSCSIVYGRVTKVPNSRYSQPLAGLPILGKAGSLTTADATDINDFGGAPCVRFIADQGKSGTKFFRGCTDAFITANAIVPAPPSGGWYQSGVTITDGTTQPGTSSIAFSNLLSWLILNTYQPSQLQSVIVGGTGIQGYIMRSYLNLLIRGVRIKKTGRPFGLPRGRALIR